MIPKLKNILSEEISKNVWNNIIKHFSFEIEAGQKGINNLDQMTYYLKNIGILDEIKLRTEQAKNLMNLIDISETYLIPKKQNKTHSSFKIKKFPAEFESQGAVFIAWPSFYREVWDNYAKLVKNLKSATKVYLLVNNEYWHRAVITYLFQKGVIDLQNVKFIYVVTDEPGIRDYGPTSVIAEGDQPVFIYSKFDLTRLGFPYQANNAKAAIKLGEYLNVSTYHIPIILEGGQILSDGTGTIFTMEEVLISNKIDFSTLEKLMNKYYGAKRIVVFPQVDGSPGGHIDPLIKFLNEETVLVAKCPSWYSMHEGLENMANILSTLKSYCGNGEPYKVYRMHTPKKTYIDIWGITQHSYINGLITNKKVLVPIFGDASEDIHALDIYNSVMPNHEVIGINFNELRLGTIHCLTKEVL
ncbi:MAG: hypothetical protein EAX96_18680 [Candidatus Lokiarchaeota archaeon]|nr:hypothetical protein [Candidatus Lokiarchaeota archaeon]